MNASTVSIGNRIVADGTVCNNRWISDYAQHKPTTIPASSIMSY